MTFFPRDTLVIGKVENGFVLRWKGTREEQEDDLDGIFVFPDIGAMCEWLLDVFPETKDKPKSREECAAEVLQHGFNIEIQNGRSVDVWWQLHGCFISPSEGDAWHELEVFPTFEDAKKEYDRFTLVANGFQKYKIIKVVSSKDIVYP